MNMNDKVTKLREIVAALRKAGIAVPESVDRSLEDLESPIYKIGVVGRLQTGKSRLVNEAFLGKELLLQEGRGLCTTAVTTEVSYGEIPQLLVNYKDERPTRVVQNPTAEDVREVTSAEGSQTRLKLAAEIESVRLELPCDGLKRFSVFDTPGIDDPDPDILQLTTYKTIPELDVTLMVVGAKALSQAELNFLRLNVFKCGIGDVMVLVSYNPERDCLSESGRAELLEAIHGQLEEVGCGSIPVKMVCYDSSVEDVLCTREAIVKAITDFAEVAAMRNRVSKLSVTVKKIVSDRIRDLSFKLSLAEKDDAELEKIRRELEQLALELESVRLRCEDRLTGILTRIALESSVHFRGACDKIFERFLSDLRETDDVGDVQKKLKSVETEIVPQVADAAVACFDTVRKRVMNEMRSGVDWRLPGICDKCNLPPILFSSEVTVNGGMCAEMSPKLVTIIDYLISMMLLPGGVFMAWALRYSLGMIPYLRKVLPTSLFKLHMEHKIAESISEQSNLLVEAFKSGLDQALHEFSDGVCKALNDEVDARIREVAIAAESKASSHVPFPKEATLQELEWCMGLVKEL